MFRFLLVGLLITLTTSVDAQFEGVYLGAGAHMTFQKPENVNFILDRYNETRTDCSVYCVQDKMPNFNFTSGPAFNVGFVLEKLIVELNWVGRKRKLTTQGVFPNGDQATRQLRFRMHSFGIAMGGFIGERDVYFIPMFSLDVGNHRVDNRAVQSGDVKDEEFAKIEKNINMGLSLSTGVMFRFSDKIGLMVRPEYQFWGFNNDYSSVNNTINPATAGNDPPELKSRWSNFGLWLSLIAFIEN